jgi:hypothetical protein
MRDIASLFMRFASRRKAENVYSIVKKSFASAFSLFLLRLSALISLLFRLRGGSVLMSKKIAFMEPYAKRRIHRGKTYK